MSRFEVWALQDTGVLTKTKSDFRGTDHSKGTETKFVGHQSSSTMAAKSKSPE
jgi:hypothetical protein